MTADTVTPTTWPTAIDLRAAASESVGALGDGRGQPELFESIGAAINSFESVINQHASLIDTATSEAESGTSQIAALGVPNYLVGTSTGTLSGEIVVGTSPGGELAGGGTSWASPKVSTVHAGSSHASVQAAAENTADAALTAHKVLGTDAHDASAISVVDAAGILLATNVEAALAEIRQGVVNRRIVDVREIGVLSTNTGAINTFNFNLIANAAPYAGHAVDWLFTEDSYDTGGFLIGNSNHRILGKAKGGVVFRHTVAGTYTVTVLGTTSGGPYGTRVQDTLIEGIEFRNTGGLAAGALKFRHVTDITVSRCYVYDYQVDGVINGSNFAGSIFTECNIQFCGTADDSDGSVIKLHNDNDNALWNNDNIVFFKCNFEQCGDRIFDCRPGSGVGAGLYVVKITFLVCKFESSGAFGYNMGGSAGNGAAFYCDNSGSLSWIMCDVTLQGMRTSHAVIPTIFRVVGQTDIHLSSVTFHLGTLQCHTNFILADAANGQVTLTDVWIDAANVSAYPDLVLKASNLPALAQRNVGFKPAVGSAMVATDWFTAAEWRGIHAGAGGANAGGVIA